MNKIYAMKNTSSGDLRSERIPMVFRINSRKQTMNINTDLSECLNESRNNKESPLHAPNSPLPTQPTIVLNQIENKVRNNLIGSINKREST